MSLHQIRAEINLNKTLISSCGQYRYRLHRHTPLQITIPGMSERRRLKKNCIFVMYNPSTADAHEDDPTVKKCRKFAGLWHFDNMWIVNLFALRSPDKKAIFRVEDPVGPDNDTVIQCLMRCYPRALIVLAWGVVPEIMGWRADEFLKKHKGCRHLLCLGTTKDGHPLHPLYLPYDTQLETYQY